MRKPALLIASILLAALPAAASATVRYVKWDKPHGGSRSNVAAIDLAARKVLWQASPGKSVNFVVETRSGILVGTDEGTVVLLDPSDGKMVWKSFLEKARSPVSTARAKKASSSRAATSASGSSITRGR